MADEDVSDPDLHQDLDPADDSSAVMAAVGRQIKLWREAAGLRAAELGTAIGYSESLVYEVEAGRRIPKPEFLDGTDAAVGAAGKVSAMKQDVAEARYPKKVKDLAKLERGAVELGAYDTHNINGLLQTAEYARALYEMRRPPFGPDEVERYVAARMSRQEIFRRKPLTMLTFVQEEVTLRRPIGGRAVLRRQLEHLLEVCELRNVEVQVMPTDREDHAGMGGQLQLLTFEDGRTVGHWEGQLFNRLTSDPKEVRILEQRLGLVRAQGLTPRESRTFIEKVLGET
ncbi:helix-turn-helix domain-containing protein [Streptomyces cyaneofuscatus]|uniref:helix-turn-helix domain-containing protein n=1 Tax=Streptomyces cyaneofuscatus TaxID=66883 RepID=UPI0037915B96